MCFDSFEVLRQRSLNLLPQSLSGFPLALDIFTHTLYLRLGVDAVRLEFVTGKSLGRCQKEHENGNLKLKPNTVLHLSFPICSSSLSPSHRSPSDGEWPLLPLLSATWESKNRYSLLDKQACALCKCQFQRSIETITQCSRRNDRDSQISAIGLAHVSSTSGLFPIARYSFFFIVYHHSNISLLQARSGRALVLAHYLVDQNTHKRTRDGYIVPTYLDTVSHHLHSSSYNLSLVPHLRHLFLRVLRS